LERGCLRKKKVDKDRVVKGRVLDVVEDSWVDKERVLSELESSLVESINLKQILGCDPLHVLVIPLSLKQPHPGKHKGSVEGLGDQEGCDQLLSLIFKRVY
jgi:hypothetical protein